MLDQLYFIYHLISVIWLKWEGAGVFYGFCLDCRNSAHQVGVGGIFDRVLTELVAKMREMKMDKTELGCLRSIILFNPGMWY